MSHLHRIISLLCLVLVAPTPAQEVSSPKELPRIAVVGASVSAGLRLANFVRLVKNPREYVNELAGRELTDAEYEAGIDSVMPGEVLSVVYGRALETHADKYLFTRPEQKARQVLTAAFESELDLVIGIDLVFWFGYGTPRGVEAGSEAARDWRLGLQVKGLALLDEFLEQHRDSTFVIGNYPDLTGALPLMMKAKMIPTLEERAELNRRLVEWCEARPRVHLFDLYGAIERLRSGSLSIEVGGADRPVNSESAFQFARVHPTRLGVAVLVRELAGFLQEVLDKSLRPKAVSDEVIVAASGAK